LVAFHRWIGPGGDELDCWVFAGIPAGVLPVVLRRSLYIIDLTPYNVVRPGASSHCERRPRAVGACYLRYRVVCVVCVVCVVRFPTLPTRRAMRTSCPRSARCITACYARTNVHMCKVGWCACVAWHATHASHARIFFYRWSKMGAAAAQEGAKEVIAKKKCAR
jgi:hypothetical protein